MSIGKDMQAYESSLRECVQQLNFRQSALLNSSNYYKIRSFSNGFKVSKKEILLDLVPHGIFRTKRCYSLVPSLESDFRSMLKSEVCLFALKFPDTIFSCFCSAEDCWKFS